MPGSEFKNVYIKVISILFAGLLGASTIIWNNSQNQIKSALEEIKKLTEALNNVQNQVIITNYKIDNTSERLYTIEQKINSDQTVQYTNPNSNGSPRFRSR